MEARNQIYVLVENYTLKNEISFQMYDLQFLISAFRSLALRLTAALSPERGSECLLPNWVRDSEDGTRVLIILPGDSDAYWSFNTINLLTLL